MTIVNLIYRLREQGIRLHLEEGDTLRIESAAAIPEDLVGEIKEQKQELIALLADTDLMERTILPAPEMEYYPLSYAQKRLWLFEQSTTGRAYQLSDAIEIDGAFDSEAFAFALQRVYERHESLRTTFIEKEGKPHQKIHSPESLALDYTYYNLTKEAAKEEKLDLLNEQLNRYFDLSKGPLFRLLVTRVATDKHILQMSMHHIISDLWSMKNFTNELLYYYDGFKQSDFSGLPTLETQYKDYAFFENSAYYSSYIEQDVAFWKDQLSTLSPRLNIPSDFSRPLKKGYEGNSKSLELGKDTYLKVKSFCQTANVRLYETLLTVVNLMLTRYSGQPDITVGLSLNGRNYPGLNDQIGFFVNLLPFRNVISSDSSFLETLDQCRSNLLSVFEHQNIPFDKLLALSDHQWVGNRFPFFDVLVEFYSHEDTEKADATLVTRPVDSTEDNNQFDLLLAFNETNDGLTIKINYDIQLYREERIDQMLVHFETLLNAVVSQPSSPTSELTLLPLATINQLHEIAGSVDTSASGHFISLLNEAIVNYPDKIAIEHGREKCTYKELDEKTDALAAAMVTTYHVSKGDRIGVMMSNTETTVLTLIAIMKMGGVFVPIDISTPGTRTQTMLEMSGARFLAIESAMLLNFHAIDGVSIIPADLEMDGISGNYPKQYNELDDTAYILFTSGSTGAPKGVEVGMASFTNYLCWANSYYTKHLRRGNFAFFTSIAFDLTLTSIFSTLLRGDAIHVYSHEDLSYTLKEICRNSEIEILKLTPTHIRLLSRLAIDEMSAKVVISGGEQLLPSDVAALKKFNPEVNIYNEYGPTEATIGCTVAHVREKEEALSIGKPIANARIFISNALPDLQPPGYIGEIYIGGACLAKGYINDRALTSDKFIPSPFNQGEFLYKSGDLGYWDYEGNLQLLGRIDNQVKLNGIRIELNDVQQTIRSHPRVLDVAVGIKQQPDNQNILIAYLVAQSEGVEPLRTKELRDYCRKSLPEFMIPTRILHLEKMPFTVNGKADFEALEQLDLPSEQGTSEFIPPSSELEKLLSEVWSEVLGMEQVGIHNIFFELGGDSIKAIQISSRLHQEGFKLAVSDLLSNPTIQQVVPHIEKNEREISQQLVTGTVSLTPIQKRFFEGSYELKHFYNQSYLLYRAEGFSEEMIITLFKKLVHHHDILRASFDWQGGVVSQKLMEDVHPVPMEVFELYEEHNVMDRVQELSQRLQMQIDLQSGSPLQLGLFHHKEGTHLLVCIHHLVIDEVSWTILLEDFNLLCERYLRQETLELPLKTDSYQSWSEALLRLSEAPATMKMEQYWKDQCLIPVSEWPVENDHLTSYSQDTASIQIDIDEKITALLTTTANAPFNTKTEDLLISALGIALKSSMGLENYWLEHEGHGREELEDLNVSRTIGWFTSLCPVLLPGHNVSGNLAPYIRTVKESLRKTSRHHLTYQLLATSQSESNNFNEIHPKIICNYLGHQDSASPDLVFEVEPFLGRVFDKSLPKDYDLEIEGYINENVFTLSLDYPTNKYREGLMHGLMENLKSAMEEIAWYCSQYDKKEPTPNDYDVEDLSIEELDSINELFN